MRKLKNDDRGVTLVEIIVSIAILAIIVLPFLNAFVTATKTNVKAKNEMNATHLATNIMEGIEKNSMKTLAYQFNYPSEGFDVADGFNISDGSSACELLKKSGKFDNVKRLEDISAEIVNKDDVITSCIHKTDASAKIIDTSLWDFRESDAHKYYFYMSGVQSGTKKYNALVTVDAKSDATKVNPTTGKKEADNKVKKYNMDEVADMSAMDANFDCMSADKIGMFLEKKVDLIQIGARNMQNFDLLKAVGRLHVPVLLKRGMSATIEEWLMSAEYIMSEGNHNVILCERGIRTFEKATRNTLDLSAVAAVKRMSHLPIIVDPSHATGRRWMVESMAMAAIAAGADGIMCEVHNDPEHAWCDGAESITPETFEHMMGDLRKLAPIVGREI